MAEQEIGVVTHWFGKIMVAGISLTGGGLKVGDRIHVVGHTSDFEQTVDSMEVEHGSIEEVAAGDDVGIRMAEHVREHDKVFKVVD